MSTQPLTRLAPQQDRLIPKCDQEKIPNCQKCGKQMRVIGESETHWTFGCEPCQCAHVFSKPQTAAAAKYRAQIERTAQTQQRIKEHGSRKKFFLLGGK